jgi:syntaxin-binding protein 1
LYNGLDANQFGFTKESDKDPVEEGNAPSAIPASGVSLRTTKPTWAKKSNSIHVGGYSYDIKTLS